MPHLGANEPARPRSIVMHLDARLCVGMEVRYNSWERCGARVEISKIVPPFFFFFLLVAFVHTSHLTHFSLPYSDTIVVLGFVCAAVWFV